jgi:hypothetical protein
MRGYRAKSDRKTAMRRVITAAFGAGAALFGIGVFCLPAKAAPKFVSCGGAAMLGGAQINCTHLDAKKPSQLCNFSWALLMPNNVPQVVTGSFLLPRGANNAIVYQGTGFTGSLSEPIILCQSQR